MEAPRNSAVICIVDPITEEFVMLSQETPLNKVSAACKNVFELYQKIEIDSKKLFSGELKKDIENLTHALASLDLKGLDVENKEKLLPTLCKVYQTLDLLLKNSKMDPNAAEKIRTRQTLLQSQCSGLGPEYCQLDSLLKLSEQFTVTHLEDFLLDVKNDKDLTLIRSGSAHSIQQRAVYALIQDIVSHLSKQEVVKHFSVPQLIQMKITVNILMANYILHQNRGLDNSEHIFSKLKEANQKLNEIISEHSAEKFTTLDDNTRVMLVHLKNTISAKLYCADFWKSNKHINELHNYVSIMQSCCKFIAKPNELNIDQLFFLAKDEETGIALYELPNSTSEIPSAIVVFSYKNENFLKYWLPTQNRNFQLNLGGLCHAPVLAHAEQCCESMKKMIKDKGCGNVPLITAGFGMDGAVAQILAYNWSLEHPTIDTRSYVMGVAPFLDVNAAANFRNVKNHYSINFVLHKDKNLEQSKAGTYVQTTYSKDNFHIQYPLFNRDWFLSDITGHDPKIYVEKTRQGVSQPQDMYNIFTEINEIIRLTANSVDLPKDLHVYFNKFKIT